MNKFTVQIILILSFILLTYQTSQAQDNFSVVFGIQKDGFHTLKSAEKYNNKTGYGFDIENIDAPKIIVNEEEKFGYCTSDVPFYFSKKLPEGTYDVKITFGAVSRASETTVKAEGRRLMLYKIKVPSNQTITKTITVNVRSTKINDTTSIRIKDREINYLNWDNRLSLEFSGEYPSINSIEIKPKKKFTTLFLAGNSTVTDQDCAPWASWGQMITRYFDDNIAIANYAESGASMASFTARGRLDKILSLMQPGDYIFIEFGHNDQKLKGEGIGPWESFTDYITEFVISSREKGGIPILITPTQRRSFNEKGKIELTHGEYPDAMRKAAEKLNVPLIELNGMTKIMYEAWGPELSRKAFVQYPANTFPGQNKKLEDNTHFNTFGANEVALCVLKGISDLDLPIKKHIINFNSSYNPAQPSQFKDWELIMSPRYFSKKPEGN